MRASLEDLFLQLHRAAEEATIAANVHDYAAAVTHMKVIMGAASKLHTRLSIIDELTQDAKFIAEVDRGLERERQARLGAIPGDVPLPFPPNGDRPPSPRRRGKGKAAS